MIPIYSVIVAVVFSKYMLKITTGPERKQGKNTEKNSGKTKRLADEETEFLKGCHKKEMLSALCLSLFYYRYTL